MDKAEVQCKDPDTASPAVSQSSQLQFVPNPVLRSLMTTGGLGYLATSVLPSELRLELNTWLVLPGTHVSCTVLATSLHTEMPQSLLHDLAITASLGDSVLNVSSQVIEGRLQLHFEVVSAGLHVVTARLAKQHILGSPLLLPVLTDPAQALAQIGLQPLDQSQLTKSPSLTLRPQFCEPREPVSHMQQSQGFGCDGVEEEEVTEWREGRQCLAKWTDGVWYRARVEAVHTGLCQVTFIDYGNSDNVDQADIVTSLKDIPESDMQIVDVFVGENLEAAKSTVVETEIPKYITETSNSEELLQSKEQTRKFPPIQDPLAQGVKSVLSRNPIFESGTKCFIFQDNSWHGVIVRDVLYDDLVTVYNLTTLQFHAVDPNNVVVDRADIPSGDILAKSALEIETKTKERQEKSFLGVTMTEALEKAEAEVKPLSRWSVGQSCIAKWDEDRVWYRAQLLEITDKGSYVVIFIDYGNEAEVTEGDLKQSVHDIPGNDEIDVNVTENDSVLGKVPATGESSLPSSPEKQIEKTQSQYKRSVGQNCIAKWSEDSVWYRAEILTDGEDGFYNVLFVDYGNEAEVGGEDIVDAASEIPEDEEIDLNINVKSESPKEKAWEEGDKCVARWEEDCVWYRAVVRQVLGQDDIHVLFADYGNEVVVSRAQIVRTAAQVPKDEDIDENVQIVSEFVETETAESEETELEAESIVPAQKETKLEETESLTADQETEQEGMEIEVPELELLVTEQETKCGALEKETEPVTESR